MVVAIRLVYEDKLEKINLLKNNYQTIIEALRNRNTEHTVDTV